MLISHIEPYPSHVTFHTIWWLEFGQAIRVQFCAMLIMSIAAGPLFKVLINLAVSVIRPILVYLSH